ncbi:MAG TPA: D-alanyl-D-alanine carboxypeptidase family protein [Clostridia bacterium]|nr:D-alanyl-D-alanine carboxypeptidase family protein [Clostridia bacterium]
MKRTWIIVISLMLSIISGSFSVAAKQDTSARSAVIMDVNSGRVLYYKNMDEKLAMASTTKIMTTLVAIESGRLNETVTVSRKASITEGSSIYLRQGEKHTVNDLLYAIMLRSGNDAAVAVAEHIGGSVEGFAALMNRKAAEIGAVNTHFDNPHGLDSATHYTTAYDLALITAYALKNPIFAAVVSSKKKTIEGPPDEGWDRNMVNKNKMLWQFDGGDGVKTGFTKKAGRCLVSSATRNGMQLVCVVLNCGPMWEESSVLLEYGFGNYSNEMIVNKDNIFKVVEVKNGKEKFVAVKPKQDYYVALKAGEKDSIRLAAKDMTTARAPLRKGEEAGRMEVYLDNKLLSTVELEYTDNVESSSPFFYLRKIMKGYFIETN